MKTIYQQHLELLDRAPLLLEDKLNALARAMLFRNQSDETEALSDLSDVFARSMALADLLGRKRLLMEADAAVRKYQVNASARFAYQSICVAKFAGAPMSRPNKKAFDEAFAHLMDTEPRLRPVADELRKAYGLGIYRGTSKLVKDSTARARYEVQLKLHGHILSMGRRDTDQEKAAKKLAEMFKVSKHYAETAYRTVISGAHTAGIFREGQRPEVRAITPAFEYTSAKVPTSRPNHVAGDGLIAGVEDPLWHHHSPPFGFNCLCGLRIVTRFELEDRNLIRKNGTVKSWLPARFHEFRPDRGFQPQSPAHRYVL